MIKKVILGCILILLLPNLTFAKTPKKATTPERITSAILPAGSFNGVAYSLNGKVYGYNQNEYFRPASTNKVLTALAAMLYLGPNYQIETHLKASPNAIDHVKNTLIVKNGILNGDIEIEFRGDPKFKQYHLEQLLSTLKKNGVKQINGDIILNYGYFAGHDYATGWSWDDLSKCYTAPPSAIIINNNCVSVKLIGTKLGEKPIVDLPDNVPITVNVDEVEVVKPAEYYAGCALEVNRDTNNVYTLTGCIPLQKPRKPLGLSFAIQDTKQWGIDIVSIIMKKIDITVKGDITSSRKTNSTFISFARYKSEPINKLLKTCLYKSVNLIADSIARTIGRVYYKRAANYHMATTAIFNILKKEKIDLGNATIIDGSGLSPHNYITPQQMLNVLTYILKNDSKLNLIELFPVAGVNGTVSGRGSMMRPPLVQNVAAKTGTLNGVSNIAGFLTTQSGKKVPFVYFLNNLSYDSKTRSLLAARRIARPHYPHERMILEHIYDEKIVKHP
jgi:D-alanyl-D-alanine carboxypeptidase/D-alanyl-D-alanine-endopeptidase (penicillin-binding protein 4)